MQLSSALRSKQLGSIFYLASTSLLPSFVLCLLYATYLSQPVILPNKTTSLGKKGQFEGSLPGLPEPEFLSRANIYPGPVSCQKQTKDSCCRKYRQWSLNPFRLRNREGGQQKETSRKPLLLQRNFPEHFKCSSTQVLIHLHLHRRASPTEAKTAARWAAKNFLI